MRLDTYPDVEERQRGSGEKEEQRDQVWALAHRVLGPNGMHLLSVVMAVARPAMVPAGITVSRTTVRHGGWLNCGGEDIDSRAARAMGERGERVKRTRKTGRRKREKKNATEREREMKRKEERRGMKRKRLRETERCVSRYDGNGG